MVASALEKLNTHNIGIEKAPRIDLINDRTTPPRRGLERLIGIAHDRMNPLSGIEKRLEQSHRIVQRKVNSGGKPLF